MTDTFSKKKRSEIMSRIRSTGSKTELALKKSLEENSIEFEYQPKMLGKPDFLVPPKIVVFCDGVFWHGRNWRVLKNKLPEGYWREHIGATVRRDRKINRTLRDKGYTVLRFWEDHINRHLEEIVEKIKEEQTAQKRHLQSMTYEQTTD